MGKRFTATEKWEDVWFRKLKPAQKLLWLYMLDRCDLAGVLDLDRELAAFCIGGNVSLEGFESRVVKLTETKIWIPKFIEFQYGCNVRELDEHAPVHRAVLKLVNRYGLLSLSTVPIEYEEPIDRLQDKDKDKDKDKNKDKPQTLEAVILLFTQRKYDVYEADKFWNHYQSNGWKVGKNAMKDWKAAAANWMKNAREWGNGRRQADPPAIRRSTYHCPLCDQDHPVSQKPCPPPSARVIDIEKPLEEHMRVK
jgi:hypothetical protein